MTTETGTRSQRHSFGISNSNNSGGVKPPKKKKKLIFKIFLGLVALGVVGLLSGLGLFWAYAKDAPKLEDAKLSDTVSSKLYDANNVVFEDLGAEKRELIQANDVPQLLKDAVVSVEDKRFYKHNGIDPIRIVGSAFSNLKTGGLQGGSTLTQQLIKLSFFSTKESDQTLKRKAQEAWMALELEREKSKDEILTYYINKVYMANGLYGMETASQTYFGKPLAELNLPQTALLAGMPQAPNDYDPYTNKETAKERRDVVLYTMKENGKISQKEYDEAKATSIDDGLQPLQQSSQDRKIVDNYVTQVIQEVEEKTGKNVYTDGLNIYTNLDMNAQKHLYDVVNTDQYVQYQDADMQVASTVIDVKTGQVKAQIGGRNIPDDTQLGGNLATNTVRDVGSTMKPMIDYGPAIENLDYSTGKILVDQPTTYSNGTPVYNADLQYYGALTMRKAIMYSRNTTAVQTFKAVGADPASAFLKGLGVEFKTLEESNAISSNTEQDGTKYGVSSLKLAAAYAAFANDGVYNKPYYVNKVVYQDESVDEFKPDSKRAMKDSTAYMMTDMLKSVITGGTAFNASIDGLIQAGKTGTSNYTDTELQNIQGPKTNVAPDSTFVGYTTHYAVSVWTGYNDKLTPINYEYWATASDVYREMMSYLAQNVSNDDWTQPDSVVRIGSELYVKGAAIQPDTYQSVGSETTTTTSETSSSSESSVESSSTDSAVTPPPVVSSTGSVESSSSDTQQTDGTVPPDAGGGDSPPENNAAGDGK